MPGRRRRILRHRDLEALLDVIAQVGFDAHVRQHPAQDDLADAPLAQLQGEVVRLGTPYPMGLTTIVFPSSM
jgi:hypothetical protein